MTIDDLRNSVSGSVSTADDSTYDTARAFHTGVGEPVVVVRPSSVDDVVAAVRYAASEQLPVAVRSGGHGVWESLPGALVIDLGELAAVDVDGLTAHVGGGAVWGDVANALRGHGLALSSGDTRSVGVGGLTLGGGVGWMIRLWGLALDQLVGAQLVTASGEVLEISADQHPELFWAIRGGSGNFGVVTRFDFATHELPEVVHGTLTIETDDLATTLKAWREAMRVAPEELNVTLMKMPAFGPEIPASTLLELVYAGGPGDGADAAIAPLLELPGVTASDIAPAAYADVLVENPTADEPPDFVDGNTFVSEFSDDVIDTALSANAESGAAMFMIRYVRGAYSRVPRDATAFAHRDAEALIISAAFLPPGAPPSERERLSGIWDRVASLGTGIYGNFSGSLSPDILPLMYPPDTLARLAAVKREWDPHNVFSRTHNVLPS